MLETQAYLKAPLVFVIRSNMTFVCLYCFLCFSNLFPLCFVSQALVSIVHGQNTKLFKSIKTTPFD